MYHAGLNRAYKGSADEIGLEDLFGMTDVRGENRSMQEFRIALSELFTGEKGSEKIAYDLVQEFGKFFFSDGRNALFLKNKKDLFDDKNAIVQKNKDNVVTGYTVFLEKDQFPPQFFRTIKYSDNPFGDQRAITTIYVRTAIKKSKKENRKIAVYERIMLPRDNEFTSKYYQLDFDDQIELMNKGVQLARLLEKPGSEILEKLRKVKTSRFNNDNLDRDPDENVGEDEEFVLADEEDLDEVEYDPTEKDDDEAIEAEPNFNDMFDDISEDEALSQASRLLDAMINKRKTVGVSIQESSSTKKEITKFLQKDFDRLLPQIQKISGYKNIESKEQFLALDQKKQESIIKKVCKS
jgi:hypothetical protein